MSHKLFEFFLKHGLPTLDVPVQVIDQPDDHLIIQVTSTHLPVGICLLLTHMLGDGIIICNQYFKNG